MRVISFSVISTASNRMAIGAEHITENFSLRHTVLNHYTVAQLSAYVIVYVIMMNLVID